MSHPLQELLGKELDGFKIENCNEVYRVTEDGERIGASGVYFRDATVARIYRSQLADSNFYKIREVLVLSRAGIRILVGDTVIMPLADEDAGFLSDLRRKILEKKLSADEQKILGLT